MDLIEIAKEIRDLLARKPDVDANRVIALPKGDIPARGKESVDTTAFQSIVRLESALRLCKIRVTTPKACFIRLVIDDKNTDEDRDEYISTDDGGIIDWFPYGKAYNATKSVEIFAKAVSSACSVSGQILGEYGG